ncbi:hypothetical protein GDO86_004562 [Hymenochirus boettgeri]|uniref:Cytoplasmic activation/proliferation-associated protein-1 C term domain-containing protein n=1 Tax=Hymenochirus boettgeri TaxID=247094 RepID=A0A8T2K5N3_9PIPI|nr:hypothetical protein GDO86_004562 [Hymenochirus boettgeri]
MVNKLLDCGYFENVPEPLVEIPKQEAVTEEVKIEAGTTVNSDQIKEPEPLVKCGSLPLEIPIRHCVSVELHKVQEYKVMETKYIHAEALKPWGISPEISQPEPKKWPSSPAPKQLLNSSALPTPSVKPWDPAPPQPKKWGSEPKERRDHIQKISQESKPAAAIKIYGTCLPAMKVANVLKRMEAPSSGTANGLLSQPVDRIQPNKVPPLVAAEFRSSPNLPKDPELRKQKLEALIDKIKGTYNFMQESMLDFEPSQRAVSLQLPCETKPVVPSVPKAIDPILQSEDICSIQNAEVSALTLDAKDDGIVNEILSEPDIPTPPVSVQLENASIVC